jgi:hypothetical protein
MNCLNGKISTSVQQINQGDRWLRILAAITYFASAPLKKSIVGNDEGLPICRVTKEKIHQLRLLLLFQEAHFAINEK